MSLKSSSSCQKAPDRGRHYLRLVAKASRRDAHDHESAQGQLGVTGPVTFKRGAAPVEGIAIELHHESRPFPQRVHLEARNDSVHGGWRKPLISTESQEVALELRPGDRDRAQPLDRRPEGDNATAPAAAPEKSVYHCDVEELKSLGLLDRALEPPAIDNPGEIEQCAVQRGRGNPATTGSVSGIQGVSVQTDPGSLPAPGAADDDVDPRAPIWRYAPERRSARATQRCDG